MARNAIEVEYLLVIGRATEKEHHDARRRRIASLAGEGIHVMTYDTLLDHYREGRGRPAAILTVNAAGFALKSVERMPEHLFAYVEPQHLKLSKAAEATLRTAGYDLDSWLKGHMLTANGKWTSYEGAGTLEPANESAAALIAAIRRR